MFLLAQYNVARMKFPLEDPRLDDFRDAIDDVNDEAEHSPGFVWRYQTRDGDATAVRVDDDNRMLINLSVWETVEHLKSYFTNGHHVAIMRRRKEWFEQMNQAHLVLWWLPSDRVPTLMEAEEKLALLRESGPTRDAFDFSNLFDAPGD